MLILLLLAAGCARPVSSTAPEPEPMRVKLGLVRATPASALAWVGTESGAYGLEGLEVSVVQLPSSGELLDALAVGTVDFALVGGVGVLKADFDGGDLVVLAGLLNRSTRRLAGSSSLTGVADLAGKRVAVGPKTAVDTLATQLALIDAGVDLDTITWRHGKGGALGGVVKGKADATSTNAPPSRVAEKDLQVLLEYASDAGAFPELQVAARIPTADGPLAAPFLRALVNAAEAYRTDRERALGWLEPHMAATPEALAWSFDHAGPAHYSWPPLPDPVGYQRVLNLLAVSEPRYQDHQAAELFDTRVIDALVAAGRFHPHDGL